MLPEKVARIENQRWASSRQPFDNAARRDALDLLHRGGNRPPDPGDEIPAEYLEWEAGRLSAEALHTKSRNRA